MPWYYAIDQQQKGPVSADEFRALVEGGTIRPETLVWRDGMADWTAHGALAATPPPAASAQPDAGAGGAAATCSECRRPFPAADMVSFQGRMVCAECKPLFFQRVQEGGPLPGVLEYGGFWIRCGAKMIDNIIVLVVTVAVVIPLTLWAARAGAAGATVRAMGLQVVMTLFRFAILTGYGTYFVGRYGATPGKMVCGLRVVRPDGSRLSYGHACGRVFATALSYLTLYIGFIIAAFDDERRALHDHVAGTRVIRSR